jgi:hypothetical protein
MMKMARKESWEAQHSSLSIMKAIIATGSMDGDEFYEEFIKILIEKIPTEHRKVLEVLPDCYYELGKHSRVTHHLFENIKKTLLLIIDQGLKLSKDDLHSSTPIKPDAKLTEIRLQILRKLLEGRGRRGGEHDEKFRIGIDRDILSVVIETTLHDNRHFREIGYMILSDVVQLSNRELRDTWADPIVDTLDVGLTDHWSEVRLAASIATATFLTLEGKYHSKELYLKRLLPKIALNRHHTADRLKSYSLDAWRTILGPKGGKEVLAANIDDTMTYYLQQIDTDDTGAREAACHALCELVMKLDESLMVCKVMMILEALMTAVRDDSWAVREAACSAIGECISRFPLVLKEMYKGDLFDLLLAHLSDNAVSVRETSAIAIAKGILVYPDVGLTKIVEVLDELLLLARRQSLESRYVNKTGDTKFDPSEKKR